MTLLIIIIVLAIIFDYINGFHDAANSIATVVSTKVLSPTQAVIWAAFFNFVAYFIAVHFLGGFGDSIANTVAKTVDMTFIESPSLVIIAGLVAAILWNLLTWWLGIPSSSSHTLIGGFGGAAIAAAGFRAVHMEVVGVIILFIFLAPLIGMLAGNLITIITLHAVKNVKPGKADRWFKGLQLVSSAMLSIGHGLNDSQKVMGIIAAALIAAHNNGVEGIPHWMDMGSMDEMHDWIPLACFTAIAVGTMSGGWKIMKTMGNRITKITPLEGFCSQIAGSLTLFISEHLRVPVSTTHVITGSIMGVGAVKRLSAVRWGVTKDLLIAWTITIPVSALMAGLVYWILGLFF
jgi:PiT family inorganic phosphate transporter